MLANPNRLRRYYQWHEHPFEGEDDAGLISGGQSQGKYRSPDSAPRKGQLVVVRLRMTRTQPFPFHVGKILEVREGEGDPEYLVQWWGDKGGDLEGQCKPGWVESVARAQRRGTERLHYYAEGPEHFSNESYTSDTSGTVITGEHLACWGFRLSYDDKLPSGVKRALHEDPEVEWEILGGEGRDE